MQGAVFMVKIMRRPPRSIALSFSFALLGLCASAINVGGSSDGSQTASDIDESFQRLPVDGFVEEGEEENQYRDDVEDLDGAGDDFATVPEEGEESEQDKDALEAAKNAEDAKEAENEDVQEDEAAGEHTAEEEAHHSDESGEGHENTAAGPQGPPGEDGPSGPPGKPGVEPHVVMIPMLIGGFVINLMLSCMMFSSLKTKLKKRIEDIAKAENPAVESPEVDKLGYGAQVVDAPQGGDPWAAPQSPYAGAPPGDAGYTDAGQAADPSYAQGYGADPGYAQGYGADPGYNQGAAAGAEPAFAAASEQPQGGRGPPPF